VKAFVTHPILLVSKLFYRNVDANVRFVILQTKKHDFTTALICLSNFKWSNRNHLKFVSEVNLSIVSMQLKRYSVFVKNSSQG